MTSISVTPLYRKHGQSWVLWIEDQRLGKALSWSDAEQKLSQELTDYHFQQWRLNALQQAHIKVYDGETKHHLGQNFLVNVGLIDHVLSKIDLKPHDHVVEIGPGLGVLTQAMAPLIARLDAIEPDNDLKQKLDFFKGMEHVNIHWQDALAQPLSSWYLNRPFRLISNLPYQITSPILFECLAAIDSLQDVVLLLQYEVVKRLSALSHTKAYGQLTVLIQAAFLK